MIGRADDNGVDVGARKDFAVVARGKQIGAPAFFRALEPAVVNVGDGNHLRTADGECGVRVPAAHSSRADQRELNPVVGGYLSRTGDLRGKQRRGKPGSRGSAEEMSSRGWH